MNYIQPPIKQFFKPSNVSIQQNKSPFPSQQSTSTSKTTGCSQKCARQSANASKKTNSPTVQDLGVDSDSNDHDVPRPEPNNVFFPPKHIPSKCQMSKMTLINTNNDNCCIFQPNQEILENGVVDFINDTVPDNEQSHDDFSKILSLQVPSKYQFEDDMSEEEDVVLDSADTHKTMASSYTNIRPITPLSVSDENVQDLTVDLTISSHDEQHQESESTSNVNSDSNSASLFSDSSVQSAAQSISCKKPRKFEKVKLNEAIMAKAPVKIVEEIPWDINGHIIYKKKCTEKTYYDKYEDGHWFKLKNSLWNGLNGKKSTGRCQGSYICHYPDCSKLSCEDIVNTIDFKREGEGIKTCSSCGRMVR